MKLHFQQAGQGRGLILLHGLFGSLDNWQTLGKHLARDFRVIAMDARNHGASPHGAPVDLPTMAADVRETMRHIGVGSAAVLGHSMGGKIAMELALSHPEAVDRLIAVDIAPRSYAPVHENILEALCGLDLTAFDQLAQIEDALCDAVPDLTVRRFLLKNARRDPAGKFFWRIGLPELRAGYRDLTAPLAAGRAYAGPALFLRGGRSDYVRPEDTAGVLALFPRAEIRTIPHAGHWVHADAAPAFLEAVSAFLR